MRTIPTTRSILEQTEFPTPRIKSAQKAMQHIFAPEISSDHKIEKYVEYCRAHAYDDEDEHEEDDEDDVGVEKRGELRVRSKYAISTMRF